MNNIAKEAAATKAAEKTAQVKKQMEELAAKKKQEEADRKAGKVVTPAAPATGPVTTKEVQQATTKVQGATASAVRLSYADAKEAIRALGLPSTKLSKPITSYPKLAALSALILQVFDGTPVPAPTASEFQLMVARLLGEEPPAANTVRK